MFQKSIPDAKPFELNDQSEDLNVLAIVRTLMRGWWVIALFGALALVGGRYYAASLTPMYSAEASLALLNTRTSTAPELGGALASLSGDVRSINTEIAVMQSRALMGRVFDRLDLSNSSEFNRRLAPGVEPDLLMSPIDYLRSLFAGRPAMDTGSTTDDSARDYEDAITRLQERFSVTNEDRSFVFSIQATSPDPQMAADLANTLAESYITDQIDVKFSATEHASEWLTERVAVLREQLEASEQRFKEFSSQTDLVSVESLEALNRQLKDLRDRLTEQRAAAETAEARTSRLIAARDAEDLRQMAEAANDRTLDRILPLVRENPELNSASFDARFDQLLERSRIDTSRAADQAASIAGSIGAMEDQVKRQSNDLVEIEQLQREVAANGLIYESFLGRLKETSVQQGTQQADSRILSYAQVPDQPFAPSVVRIQAVSLLLGLALGAALVLGREVLQNTLRTAEDLERVSGIPVIGQIPIIPHRNRLGSLTYLSQKSASPAAEAIRNLRTSVMLSNVDEPPQVIMSTSSVPGEGKTTLSIGLAQNFVGLSKRVLLIEGDIRRRVFSEYFDFSETRGLLSALSGSGNLDDVTVYSDLLRCDVLLGEKSSENAADIYSSEAFKRFMVTCRDTYDTIIIDTPPVLVVPDARIIGQSCDAILYSVKWDDTSRQQVQEGLRQFETVNLKVTGLILNQISPRGMKRYGYGERYGAYASYGKSYYDT